MEFQEEDIREIREKVIKYFQELGFSINPHLKPNKSNKRFLREIHHKKRLEKLQKYRYFLESYYPVVQEYYKGGVEINPQDIQLEIKFIDRKKNLEDYALFKWWNLVWWSIPYEKSVGRRINYMLFDVNHNLPFGLVVLQSPVMYCKARDEYLGITKENRDYWINQSLYGQRIGALPPYNEILGGKMVAMSLLSTEIRKEYRRKYSNKKTSKKKRLIPPRLLFIYTLSAYGRSKIYEDLYYNSEPLSIFVGYSSGSGTFHISDEIYRDLITLLGNVNTSVFVSPSRKLKLVSKAFRIIGLPDFEYHNIKRGVYIFPHARNIVEVIRENSKPKWLQIKFKNLYEIWLENYVLNRVNKDRISVSWDHILRVSRYPFRVDKN